MSVLMGRSLLQQMGYLTLLVRSIRRSAKAVGKTVPGWSVPKFLFDWLSLLSPRIRYKVDKLLGDEYYSSEKLEGMDFRAEKSLRDFDKSDFSVGSSHLSRKVVKAQREK